MRTIIFMLLFGNLFADSAEYIAQININLENQEYLKAQDLFDKGLLEYNASAELYFVGAQIQLILDALDKANKYFLKAIDELKTINSME